MMIAVVEQLACPLKRFVFGAKYSVRFTFSWPREPAVAAKPSS
jgi:hypothetical protein